MFLIRRGLSNAYISLKLNRNTGSVYTGQFLFITLSHPRCSCPLLLIFDLLEARNRVK